jgi:tetratricopeptide (TPR) repeat protein
MIPMSRLKDFCKSHDWTPVYLDEMAAVFLRRTPATESLIKRLQIDCASAPLPVMPLADSAGTSFNQLANAAGVLASLNRWYEALGASDKALRVFPDSPYLHWLRGNIFYGMGRRLDAEPEFLAAVKLDPNEITWSSLGLLYHRQGRIPEATHAMQNAVALSTQPHFAHVHLAQFYLEVVEPEAALRSLDEAVRAAPNAALTETGRQSLAYSVAHVRASAWHALNDPNRAITYEEEAVRIAPDSGEAWTDLARLYGQQGRTADEHHAEQRASEVSAAANQ